MRDSQTVEERVRQAFRFVATLDVPEPRSQGRANPAGGAARTSSSRRRRRQMVAASVIVVAAVATLSFVIAYGPRSSTPGSKHPQGPASRPTVASSLPSASTSTSVTTMPHAPENGTAEGSYEPFTAGGAVLPSLRVTTTLSGHCVSGGVEGASSYRCFAGNDILDPCFARPGTASGPVLCSADPADPDVVQLETGVLPPPLSGAPTSRPWAVALSSGQVCVLVNAAWSGLGPFSCQPSGGAVADCHAPTPMVPWWTAECQAELDNSAPFTPYRISRVWT